MTNNSFVAEVTFKIYMMFVKWRSFATPKT